MNAKMILAKSRQIVNETKDEDQTTSISLPLVNQPNALDKGVCDDGVCDDAVVSEATSSSKSTFADAGMSAWLQLDGVDTQFDEGTSDSTRELATGVIRRTLTDADQVTQLIQQGANPSVEPSLRHRADDMEDGGDGEDKEAMAGVYPLLSLVIDDMTESTIPSIWAEEQDNGRLPVRLPRWPSPQLQDAVMTALIDGGADVNARFANRESRPIRVAVAAANRPAVRLLLQRGVQLRGFLVMRLPEDHSMCRPTPECERLLMAIYRRLIQLDSTLATERGPGGFGLAHWAATRDRGRFSQCFIYQYMDLLLENNATINSTSGFGDTPLHEAVIHESLRVTEWLCGHLPADDINRGTTSVPTSTPLAIAAGRLDHYNRRVDDDGTAEDIKEDIRTRDIPNLQTIIRTILRVGAGPSIMRMRAASHVQRRERQLVLAEYATVLNGLSDVTMSAINTALAPQRDHSMLLARLLPLAPHHDGRDPAPSPLSFGPHEAEAIGWKIGAFLYEPPAAAAAIDEYLISDSTLRRRVKAAVAHFVKSAATRTSSNREVIGDMANVGGVMVRVPLQCFAVRGQQGGQHRLLGVREVVHKARLDEAASHGVTGVVKGFNAHVGDDDCVFEWRQLGYIDETTRLFVALGID
ncbi:unnamed protein product [Vitrella brassicaformis CCMP3155]|uniref:Uncharacterized protein n=1 Tax=Vitrella brassicaformis (strain CCMP3155) TaxID=1169540 RepID=A0A0G4EYN8_VITBC|nr:unnamed protein product [Vitrella brassicaformis CCMP3155]|eukprot:CEM03570.1 unnamed protein product [Vitrella brassicaformis CCMP3155]